MFPSPSPAYQFRDIMDVFTQQIADNEWNDVKEGFCVLRKTKSPFLWFLPGLLLLDSFSRLVSLL